MLPTVPVMPRPHPSIELRCVSRLLTDDEGVPARYFVPAFQRGYRWSRIQVTQLLDDIWEFIQNSEGKEKSAFYCLQPLVVRRKEDGSYEVIDGQQRLTTLFILLAHRKDIIALLGKTSFKIAYETRDTAFLEAIDLERTNENVDFFHIGEAWRAIDAWVKQHDGMHTLKLLQHLLNDDEAGRNVRVIWYELAHGDDAIAAFTRLNVGKIPLTETELVRALFLRRAANDESGGAVGSPGRLSLRIAYEWDQIEKRLQDNAVWYFLQNASIGEANRIGLVFRLAAQIADQDVTADYGVFAHFAGVLSTERSAEREWQRVKDLFMTLEEWFEDRELFHILGFVLQREHDSIGTIAALVKESRNSRKAAFAASLRGRVFRMLLHKNIDAMAADEIARHVDSLCRDIGYGDGRIRDLMLLFNLATLLEHPHSNVRFQFDSFKRESWDIEHVRSVSDQRPDRPNEQQEWLHHCLAFLRSSTNDGSSALVERIETYLATDRTSREDFSRIDGDILAYFGEKVTEPDHTLGNLTLLDSGTNRSYKNAVFAVKREQLLLRDRASVFVPVCTRNVFLKYYSREVGNMMFWTTQDAQHYADAIAHTLTRFFASEALTQ